MGFLGVYKALYDYEPQSEGELAITEGDTLYVLEKSTDDDWWKAKKKAAADDEDEPTGLIPNNYVEEVQPQGHARALYEYTRQTDEELSFPEDAQLAVYDTSDPDWILVGLDGDFGFVPANYIDQDGGAAGQTAEEEVPETSPPPSLPARTAAPASPPLPPRNAPAGSSSPVAPGPAAALAGVMAGRSASSSHAAPAALTLPPRPTYTSEESEDEAVSPPLPNRPRAQSVEQALSSPTSDRDSRRDDQDAPTSLFTPGGFHMYNINEMVSVMGKRKKMPTTLGINLKTGTILIAPERAQDGPSQEWTADRMSHYSREGKHVFLELIRPSKSVDFHAGAKDTAEEIVAALGEMAGAAKALGLREVIAAGTGAQQKQGQVLYDFMAQGDDEVTVAAGDEVIVLDDSNDEWWQVRRLKNGKQGVMPGSYVEVTGTVAAPAPSAAIPPPHHNSKTTVEQNRREEARLTREAVKAAQREEERERGKRQAEVGPGINLPDRTSSLSARDSGNKAGQQRSTRENGSSKSGKSKPDPNKVRVWKDRSNSFSVEAQFIGLKDGKINLHKVNGVKIAVPIAKMSLVDIEWVEAVTGLSLDEEKPLSEVKKKAQAEASNHSGSDRRAGEPSSSRAGASVEQPQKPEYDWFSFFLACDVPVGLCERYAQAFNKDSMDESVLPDVDANILRTLGLREGDIIKVMRFLDNKYGRTKKAAVDGDGDTGGGLFSGPGGSLRNNTRKGRPAPAVQTNDVIDAKAFSQSKESSPDSKLQAPATSNGNNAARRSGDNGSSSGFDDDAWNVKPLKQQTPEPTTARAPEPAPAPTLAAAPRPVQQPLSQNMQELSLLSQPLQPTKVETPAIQPPPVAPQAAPVQAPATAPPVTAMAPPQPTGATPSFFTAIAQQQTGLPPPMAINGQQTGIARQRPIPPQFTSGQGALVPPPPSRPLSAPQSAQPSAFAPPPLQPQMTGIPYQTQQIAPPGQSLNEISQARMQQQYLQMQQQQQQQMTQQQQLQSPPMAFGPQPTGMVSFPTGMQPQPTSFMPGQFGQNIMQNGGVPMQSPFADPIRPQQFSPIQPQPTGFPGQFGLQQGFGGPPGAAGGLNNYLPPALEPQRTAAPVMPQMSAIPPMPSMPTGFGQQQQSIAPLQPQKTGPPPPVRFGVTPEAQKLMAQPTGRRANLASATPQNPFGF